MTVVRLSPSGFRRCQLGTQVFFPLPTGRPVLLPNSAQLRELRRLLLSGSAVRGRLRQRLIQTVHLRLDSGTFAFQLALPSEVFFGLELRQGASLLQLSDASFAKRFEFLSFPP